MLVLSFRYVSSLSGLMCTSCVHFSQSLKCMLISYALFMFLQTIHVLCSAQYDKWIS